MKKILSLTTIFAICGTLLFAQEAIELKVQLDKTSGKISPHMWGIFFEDINMGADGGIYAELIKNRSFEFDHPMMGWKRLEDVPEGTFLIVNDRRRKGNPRSLKIHKATDIRAGLQNEGFRGMGVKKGDGSDSQLRDGLSI